MSKIDEAKLNAAMKNIAEYLQSVSELSLKCHQQIADVFTSGTVGVSEGTKGGGREQSVGGLDTATPVSRSLPNFFPDPYADMMRIEFDEQGNVYRAYPVKFLGTDNFKQIADIVQKLGGAYVKGDKTQGVKAHFTIPKGENKP